MIPLAYHSVGSWAAHVVVGSLIHRAVWSLTRGMSTGMLVVLAIVGVVGLAAWSRRA